MQKLYAIVLNEDVPRHTAQNDFLIIIDKAAAAGAIDDGTIF